MRKVIFLKTGNCVHSKHLTDNLARLRILVQNPFLSDLWGCSMTPSDISVTDGKGSYPADHSSVAYLFLSGNCEINVFISLTLKLYKYLSRNGTFSIWRFISFES